MINENFAFLAAALLLIGIASYVYDTLRGKVKPNRISWFLWALAPLVGFAAEVKDGVGLLAIMTFFVGFDPLLVVIASFFNKDSQWKVTKFDLICGFLSIAGLLLWLVTKTGSVAIIFAILADFLAGVPTIIKSFKFPETENAFAYFTGVLAAPITVLTITHWTFSNYAFPIYIFFMNLLIFSLIKFKIGKKF